MDSTISNIDLINGVIGLVDANKEAYSGFASLLEMVLNERFGGAQMISVRPKSSASLAGKILRKYTDLKSSNKIYAKLTDLIGARVIFLRYDDVYKADKMVRQLFDIDEHNSVDVSLRLRTPEFGYQSLHYIIKCNDAWLDKIMKEFPNSEISQLAQELKGNPELTAELQVRSWLQHIWAEIGHDSVYKGDLEVPRDMQRIWFSLAADLERTDKEVSNYLDKLDSYRQGATSYYIADELQKKIDDLKTIIEVLIDKDINSNKRAIISSLNELFQLYDIQGWDDDKFLQCKSILTKIPESSHLTRRLEITQGVWSYDEDAVSDLTVEELIKVAKLKPDMQNTIFNLAFDKEPNNPKVILEYLFSKDDLQLDSITCQLLKGGLARCEQMIAVSLELPWAFAGKVFISSILLSLGYIENTPQNIADIYDAALRLINLCNSHSIKGLKQDQKVATLLSLEALRRVKDNIGKIVDKSDSNQIVPLSITLKLLLELGYYTHSKSMFNPLEKQVVIVAGGCSSLNGTPALTDFKDLMTKTMNYGKKSVILHMGDGTSGICSLSQIKQELKNCEIQQFGLNKSGYKKHSIYEALLGWKSLMEAGYSFDDIALIAFGLPASGGISTLECKVALSFGARVTVIGHKDFNSYNETFENIPFWSDHPSLVRLPVIQNKKPQNCSFEKGFDVDTYDSLRDAKMPEPGMLRAFMFFKKYKEQDYLDTEDDEMVKKIHYRKQLNKYKSTSDLKDLTTINLYSSLHRYLFFKTLLDDSGANVTTKIENIEQMNCEYYKFGELEHARWYIERWLQGTRYGKDKITTGDDIRNPCMIAWYDLDDDTILKDLDYLNRYIVAMGENFDKVEKEWNEQSNNRDKSDNHEVISKVFNSNG